MLRNISLLNAMDVSCGIDYPSFEKSLVMNVLFQDKVLTYDASIFSCSNLLTHMSRTQGRESLFELACRDGIITPTFRDRSVTSFTDAITGLRKRDHVSELPGGSDYYNRIAIKVDNALLNGKTHPVYPSGADVGVRFGSAVRTMLCRDKPPEDTLRDIIDAGRSDHLLQIWQRTAKWRTDLIEIADRRTAERGHTGIRRQEIYNAIGESLGVSKDKVTYEDLYDVCERTGRKREFEAYARWLAQCHFVSQAGSFSTSINFPVYNFASDFMLDSVLRAGKDKPPRADVGFRCQVVLPDIGRLSQVDPANLMAIRNELGLYYLKALNAWQANPDENTQGELTNALKFYCTEISARYNEVKPKRVEVKYGKEGTSKFALTLADQLLKYVPFYSQVRALGTVIFEEIQRGKEEETNKILPSEIELTLPESKAVQ